jgi:predicted ribonuclease YlaK
MKKWLVDTNAFIDGSIIVDDTDKIIVSSPVLRELDKFKSGRDRGLAYAARNATRWIEDNLDKVEFNLNDYQFDLNSEFKLDPQYQDNNIIQCCVKNGYGIITNDLLLKMKARGFGIEVKDYNENEDVDTFNGVKDLFLDSNKKEDQETLAQLYELPEYNSLKLVPNEYLSIWDLSKPTYDAEFIHNGYELIDQLKWDGHKLTKIKYKNTESRFMGKVTPINYKQKLLFDLLQNKNIGIKLCQGGYGTGKDYTMVANMIQMIERGDFEKMVFIRNTEPLDGSKEVGFLPGDLISKMADWCGMIADALGGQDGLQMLIDKGKIEIAHFSALRGRSFTNSILYCSEGQNLSSSHMKLIISRVGQGSELWVNGDLKQTDNKRYDSDSGIRTLYRLKGHKLFGMVTLDKSERSDVASLVELL